MTLLEIRMHTSETALQLFTTQQYGVPNDELKIWQQLSIQNHENKFPGCISAEIRNARLLRTAIDVPIKGRQ